ncbi:MAG: CvpA family protein [Gammaproteobacteria bacterium]|nr:CvpA family protein [Gammaproteobacteria bacterium]MCP5424800.1 CvpA family protein [Gammaproteobacteria bacterium]MCP5458223.1 CvpA family protein [Gammaproteobacteria bacterium]
MLNSFTWVDFLIIGVIVLSMVVSLVRGFLKEAISLATWIVAFVIAFIYVDPAAAHLDFYLGIPSISIILAFGGLFLVTLILGGLVNLTVAQLVKRTGLSGTDRLLGVVFGLLRGGAIVAMLVLVAGLTPLPQDPWWSQSPLLLQFQEAAMWLREFLPPDIAAYFKYS